MDEVDIHTVNQTIGLIKEEHMLSPEYDAIVGLAYPTMADAGDPIFDTMMNQGLLA